ncbi:hypothetical protein MTO96_017760 [Rhipicephalus appendiculatus]
MHLTFSHSTGKGIFFFLVLPRNLLSVKGEALGSTFESQDSVNLKKDAGASAQLPLSLLAILNDKVHLGSGIFVKQEQWAWLLSRPKDSLFFKEATKLLWGIPDLQNRSLTGAPCRRIVRQDGKLGPPRRGALTPQKLRAMANGFVEYVRPTDVPAADRLRKRNRFIAEMLNDLNKS